MNENHLKQTVLETEQKELEAFILEHKTTLQGRKLVSEFLLFVGCQTMGAGLAILLFQFTFRLWVLCLICYSIGLIPTLPDLCEINLNKTESGEWEVRIMRSPVKTFLKFLIGVGITYVGINETRDAVKMTYTGISKVYNEIQTYERPSTGQYELPIEPIILLAAIGIVAVLHFIKSANKD